MHVNDSTTSLSGGSTGRYSPVVSSSTTTTTTTSSSSLPRKRWMMGYIFGFLSCMVLVFAFQTFNTVRVDSSRDMKTKAAIYKPMNTATIITTTTPNDYTSSSSTWEARNEDNDENPKNEHHMALEALWEESSRRMDAEIRTGKKYFVLHVGPYKMATTFIQQASGKKYANTTLLSDNYHYKGKGSIGFPSELYTNLKDFECRKIMDVARAANEPQPECWNNLVRNLEKYNDRNLFISSEDLHSYDAGDAWWQDLKDASEACGFELLVIVGYRRLFEWLPSAHSQHYSGSMNNKKWTRWPIDGGERINPLFPELFGYRYFDGNGSNVYFPWTPEYLENLPDFIETKIWNLHANPEFHFLTNVFCRIMPNTYNMCRIAIDEELTDEVEPISNPSSPITYDQLAIVAADIGLIDTTKHKRRDTWKGAIKYHARLNNTADIMKYNCPSNDQLEKLLLASAVWEQKTMPEFFDRTDHDEKFWKHVSKKKFCFIDGEKTLEMKEWKEFFENLLY